MSEEVPFAVMYGPPYPQHPPPQGYGPYGHMPPPAPFMPSAQESNLRVLSILYYVMGAFKLLTLGIIALYVFVIGGVLAASDPKLAAVAGIVVLVGAAVVLLAGVFVACLFYSGYALSRRKHRVFSLVLAGLLCLSLPFGTALGIFTLIILCKPETRALYGES